jgi:hypothetical protein
MLFYVRCSVLLGDSAESFLMIQCCASSGFDPKLAVFQPHNVSSRCATESVTVPAECS